MNPRSPSVLFRHAVLLLISAVALSVAGRTGAEHSALSLCAGWPLCVPSSPSGWLKNIHALLVAAAALQQIAILLYVWRTRRADAVLLPLATITFVLFFGQAFLGAMMVARNFREDLVVLHAANAVSFWVSMLVLTLVAWFRMARHVSGREPRTRRSWRDFVTLTQALDCRLAAADHLGGSGCRRPLFTAIESHSVDASRWRACGRRFLRT